MSRAISQAVAPAPGGVPCSPQVPVRPESRSSHPDALVSLIAALASLGGGLSPWAVPPMLLLGASGLFHVAPAQAQSTTVWSGTLTVRDILPSVPGTVIGCADGGSSPQAAQCEPTTGALTDDDFSWRGATYEVRSIIYGSRSLTLDLNRSIPDSMKKTFFLTVGSLKLSLADATLGDGTTTNSGLIWNQLDITGWSVGATFAMSLEELAGAPEGLAVALGDGKLELTWTAVPGDPEGYDVEYRQLGASSWTDAGHTGTDPSETITGLTNQRGHEVRVRWSDGDATGPWATGSGIPTGQTLTLSVNGQLAEGGENVTLTATLGQAATRARTIWVTPTGTATGGTRPIGNADWSANPSQRNNGERVIPLGIAQGSTSATATLTVVDDEDVDAGETIVLEARVDGSVVSQSTPTNVDLVAPLVSNTLTLTIEDNEEGPPGPTTALKVTPGDGKLALSWTAPPDNGGSAVTDYHVHYTSAAADTVADDRAVQTGASPSPGNGWVEWNRSGTAASQEITDLMNNEDYRVRVRGENGNGHGPWTHGKGTPLAAAQPPEETGTTVWSATLTVKGTLAGLTFGCDNSTSGKECSSTSVLTEDQFTYDGVTYDITTIRASAGKLTFVLNGNAPSAFDSFTLEVDGSSAGSPASLTGTSMNWENTGLSWSAGDTVSLRLVEGPPGSPSAPTEPTDTDLVTPGDGKLDLSWTAPAGTVTGYDVHYTSASADDVAADEAVQTGDSPSPSAADGWVAVDRGTEEDPPMASQTITGLDNDTPYRVRVRAKNSNGDGAWLSGRGTPSSQTVTPVQSGFATLSGFTVNTSTDGTDFSNELTLNPAFSSATSDYTATVGQAVTHVRLTPSFDDATFNVQAGKVENPGPDQQLNLTTLTADSPSADVTLNPGENLLRVVVNPKAGPLNQITYRITVTRVGGSGGGGEGGAPDLTMAPPVVTIAAVEEEVTEGGAARFTVSATPAPATGTSLSVSVSVSQRGDFASPSQTGARTVVVDDSGTASFSVSTEDDAIHGEDGAITATVQISWDRWPVSANGLGAVSLGLSSTSRRAGVHLQ